MKIRLSKAVDRTLIKVPAAIHNSYESGISQLAHVICKVAPVSELARNRCNSHGTDVTLLNRYLIDD